MTTDTTEKGLEAVIARAMTGRTNLLYPPYVPSESCTPVADGTGWLLGSPQHYDRAYCVDLVQLRGFLRATQPKLIEEFQLELDNPTRSQFLARLSKEISARGIVDVLRKGIDHGPHHVDLYYATPSEGNDTARELFASNRFSVTRQLAYSKDQTRRALDLGLFLNGLPIATFELKNNLTKQNVEDAIQQYKTDRDPREPLFAFGRCVVHFAVDDNEARFCTELKGKESWFLPFNKGWMDGRGNPPNPEGIKTDYLWKEILKPASLADILENFAQIVEEVDSKTGKKKRRQVFPRYHQLEVVRRCLADVRKHGVGRRYLIQHSAGSGKSNSITWLAHQLVGVHKGEKNIFDSVIVVTDRRVLDDQIQRNIKQFAQVGSIVGAVASSSQGGSRSSRLSSYLESGKKIIITTVQTFPPLLELIGNAHRGKRFAILIDEAHSSQGGKTASAMSEALAESAEDPEDTVNAAMADLERRMASRKMLANASYFAFTATPKPRTLQLFGNEQPPDPEGKVGYDPFHSYTMKQAIQEGFILDVLQHYMPIDSYYGLIKRIEDDPEFDVKKARKKLRRYVEGHREAIHRKATTMVQHFEDCVVAPAKMKGKARAMVVTGSIARAVEYFNAFKTVLQEKKSPWKAVVAFSGEHDFGEGKINEAMLNGFPSAEITSKIVEDPYRFLICAEKFQTGYDEPLLHTMYVDKALSDIKAVQTLSRLNRAHPDKRDVFVLDFQNDTETIVKSFERFYRTTHLGSSVDPNVLHDLKSALDATQVYTSEEVDEFVRRFLAGDERPSLDPLLDTAAGRYIHALDENAQVEFKGKAKSFVRTYDFLAAVLPYSLPSWEKLSIFLTHLVNKLPSPKEEDLAAGILETIDMESYRLEKRAVQALALADEDAVIEPPAVDGNGRRPEPELDRLSNILASFNEQYGTLFTDSDRILNRIKDEIAPRVAADPAYQNALKNTPHMAPQEMRSALQREIVGLVTTDTELFKQYMENPGFQQTVAELVTKFVRLSSAA